MEHMTLAEIARRNRIIALTTRAARHANPVQTDLTNRDSTPIPTLPMAVSASGSLHLVLGAGP